MTTAAKPPNRSLITASEIIVDTAVTVLLSLLLLGSFFVAFAVEFGEEPAWEIQSIMSLCLGDPRDG
jgi:hypothetical protein